MRSRFRTVSILALLLCANGSAASISEINVSRSKGELVSTADFVVNAPREEVVRAFSSFDSLAELNPAIVESSAETLGDGQFRVTTRVKDCVLMFCKAVTLVERVRIDTDGNMRSEIQADGSDFKHGSASWTFEARGSQTFVSYRSAMRPDFWMPPLLGRQAMQGALERQILASIEKLERDRKVLASRGR
ncbi:MAG: SRPBCC family protein [Pseudomonadota bacterium]